MADPSTLDSIDNSIGIAFVLTLIALVLGFAASCQANTQYHDRTDDDRLIAIENHLGIGFTPTPATTGTPTATVERRR